MILTETQLVALDRADHAIITTGLVFLGVAFTAALAYQAHFWRDR